MINYFLFFTLAFFWGGSFVAIKVVVENMSASEGAFFRVFFSLLFLLLIYCRKVLKINLFHKESIGSAIAGLCSIGIPFALLFWGEQYIAPSLAAIINGTVPFWTLLIALLFFKGSEKVNLYKILGLIFGFIGIGFIFGPKVTFSNNIMELYGLLAVTLMAIFYGLGLNLSKNLLIKNKAITGPINTVVQQISSVTFLFLFVLITNGYPDFSTLTDFKVGGAVFYLSFFSTCLAFIIFYKLILILGSVQTSTVTFFVPPIAMLLDYFLFSTKLGMFELIGGLVILLSMFLLKKGDLELKKAA